MINKHLEILLELRDELYGGSWNKFLEDLISKRDQRKYTKHRINIDRDINKIKEIMMSKISIVSGGFDPVHIGHLRMFEEAAKIGKLIVILNSDEWLMRKKGKYFMPWEHRAEIIKAFRCVDAVIPVADKDNTVCEAIKVIARIYGASNKLVFCNGGDRIADNVPEHILCEEIGISCVWNVGGDKIESSSELISKYEQNGPQCPEGETGVNGHKSPDGGI